MSATNGGGAALAVAAAAALVAVGALGASFAAAGGDRAAVEDDVAAADDDTALLRLLRVSELQKRARGLGDDALALALDGDDPKAALLKLISGAEKEAPPAAGASGTRAAVLGTAGEPAAELENEALDQPVDAAGSAAAAPAEREPEASAEASDLARELQGVRLMALHKRALSEGVTSAEAEEAMDHDDPKGAVIRLIVEAEASRGPADRAATCLRVGGDAAAEMITGALDHAMDVLEQLSTSTPRKSRRCLLEIMERVEAVLDSVDVEWCDGVSRCGDGELESLCGLLVRVRGLSSSSAVSDAYDAVSDVLECLDRCGSVVMQSMCVLSAGAGAGAASVVGALESLRGLSEERLDCVSADEAAAYDVVKLHMCGLESCVGAEAVSGCMALFTLGCRNGMALCGTVEVMELATGMGVSWLKYASTGGDDFAAGAAPSALFSLVGDEASKIPSESRGPVEKVYNAAIGKKLFPTAGNAFTEQRAREVLINSMKAGVLFHDDIHGGSL